MIIASRPRYSPCRQGIGVLHLIQRTVTPSTLISRSVGPTEYVTTSCPSATCAFASSMIRRWIAPPSCARRGCDPATHTCTTFTRVPSLARSSFASRGSPRGAALVPRGECPLSGLWHGAEDGPGASQRRAHRAAHGRRPSGWIENRSFADSLISLARPTCSGYAWIASSIPRARAATSPGGTTIPNPAI